MEKEKLNPLSGFRDYLSDDKSTLLALLENTFQKFGYQALETPIIDRSEILLSKYGADAQKLLYLFKDNGDREVGLRYDLTVPLARYVSANFGQLTFPFKRYEIGSVFRAEKPQAGRYRQFTQADIDIVGSEKGEEELLEIVSTFASQTGLKLTVLINDRRLVDALFDELGVNSELRPAVYRLLDKKGKITDEKFSSELSKIDLTAAERKNILKIFSGSEDLLGNIEELVKDKEVIDRIKQLIKFGKSTGLTMKFDPAMVRGLDYYTGIIFEVIDPNYQGGSLISGGRYDGLVNDFIGQKLPAVGISFGVDRLIDVVDKANKPKLFIANLPELETEIRHLATDLRSNDQVVEVYADSSVELGKQIKYADKRGYQTVLIPLEESWKKGLIEIKHLSSGKQESVKRSEIIVHHETL